MTNCLCGEATERCRAYIAKRDGMAVREMVTGRSLVIPILTDRESDCHTAGGNRWCCLLLEAENAAFIGCGDGRFDLGGRLFPGSLYPGFRFLNLGFSLEQVVYGLAAG